MHAHSVDGAMKGPVAIDRQPLKGMHRNVRADCGLALVAIDQIRANT